jgi:hypothetical protein
MIENCNILQPDEFYHGDKYQAGTVKKLIAKDNGDHQFELENESGSYLIKLKLVEKQTEKRCDFLILDCTGKAAFFVELKGQKLSDAVSQIQSTLGAYSSRLTDFQFYCRVVQTRVFGARSQIDKAKLMKYLHKNHKSNVQKGTRDLVKIGSQKLVEKI